MAVRNQHVRQPRNYIFKEIHGINYMFTLGMWSTMSRVRYVANKAAKGKLELNPALRGVEVQEDGSIRQFKL